MSVTDDLGARIAALESQIAELMNNSAIQAYLSVDRQFAAAVEAGKRAEAPVIAEREAAERELQAANVVWISAQVPSTARRVKKEDGVFFVEWREPEANGRTYRQRLGAPPHDGRIQMRADAWAARLARCPELAALVDAEQITVREVDRDEAIDLERRARLEERGR